MMDTRNPQLREAMTMLETYQRESKIPRGFPPGTEFKTLSGPGIFVLGSSLDAGRAAKQRRGEVEYISPDRWRRILSGAVIDSVAPLLDG